jgi:hypothetical protein
MVMVIVTKNGFSFATKTNILFANGYAIWLNEQREEVSIALNQIKRIEP